MSILSLLTGAYPLVSVILVVIMVTRQLIFSRTRRLSHDDILEIGSVAVLWPLLIVLLPWSWSRLAIRRLSKRRNGEGV